MCRFGFCTRPVAAALITAVCGGGVWAESAPPLSQELSVQLVDGRILRGVVDRRSDDHHLRLTLLEPGLTITSHFPWSQVVGASVGKLVLDAEELRAAFAKSPNGAGAKPTDGNAAPDETAAPAATLPPPEPCPDCQVGGPPLLPDPRVVRSLRIEVHLANWDDDVEPDGLRVVASPVDWHGHVVPVRGQVDFRLLGQRVQQGGRRVSRQRSFGPLENWSRRMLPVDFGPAGVAFELPFRGFHPDRDFQFAPDAVLTARLAVPGNGVFNASAEFVWLRPANRLRDSLQLRTGNRYFSEEFDRLRGRDRQRLP